MKTSTPKVKNKLRESADFSIIKWTAIAAISLFFLISPYYAALFNGTEINQENQLYSGLMVTFAILVLLSIFLFTKLRINNYKFILSLLILLLPILYLISSLQAASAHYSRNTTYIYFAAAAFFTFSLYFINTYATKRWFVALIQYTAYSIVIYGVLNLFGQTFYPDALWKADENYRLTSVFQYSNTYAGFLIAILLAALYLIVHSESKRWYSGIFHALMLVPIFLSFMLTYSRGALVFIPIIILLIIPFFSLVRQILFLLFMTITTASTFLILGNITSNYDAIARIVQPKGGPANPISFWHDLALSSWLFLISASILTAAIILVCNKWLTPWLENKLQKLSLRKWSSAALPIGFVCIGILFSLLLVKSGEVKELLPEQLANRIGTINLQQHSVLERVTFYKDAMKVVKDYPLIGTGGGGWAAVYEQYQSNPYSSNQAHSYFIQVLVEIGWIGFIVLIGILLLAYSLFIKLYLSHKELRGTQFFFFIVSISILVHSTIDFDMSYYYVMCLVFFCLGAMIAPYQEQLTIVKWDHINTTRWKHAFPACLLILGIVLFSLVLRQYNANQYYGQALHKAIVEKLPLDQLLPDINTAINTSPDHPAFALTKADWLSQGYSQTGDKSYLEQAKSTLSRVKSSEPHNRKLILAEYRNFKDLGAYKESVNILTDGLNHFPWDINFYEAAIMEYFLSGQSISNFNIQDANKENWNTAIQLYEDVLQRMEKLKELPENQLQGRSFELTIVIRHSIGAIFYYQQNYEKAAQLLKPITKEPLTSKDSTHDSLVRSSFRYYLAALKMLGESDINLENKLFSADANEKKSLKYLLNSK